MKFEIVYSLIICKGKIIHKKLLLQFKEFYIGQFYFTLIIDFQIQSQTLCQSFVEYNKSGIQIYITLKKNTEAALKRSKGTLTFFKLSIA